MSQEKKIYLEIINSKGYTRYLVGDYHPAYSPPSRDDQPQNAYVDNVKLYKSNNVIDEEGTALLDVLMKIEKNLEPSLIQLLEDEAERVIN